MDVSVDTGNILAEWNIHLSFGIGLALPLQEESLGIFRHGPGLRFALWGGAVIGVRARIGTRAVWITPLKIKVPIEVDAGATEKVAASVISATKIEVFPPVQLGILLLKYRDEYSKMDRQNCSKET